jgi:hypothetical protein
VKYLNIKKPVAALCLALLFVIAGGIMSVTADQPAEEATLVYSDAMVPAFIDIAPASMNIAGMTAMLHFPGTNGRAVMGATVTGHPGTTHIATTMVLERVSANGTVLSHIGSWSGSADHWWFAWERPHYVARGHNYRLTVTATVTRNGNTSTYSVAQTTWAP